MHGTRHVAALYDLIGKSRLPGDGTRGGVPRGVPTKPLVELACVRVAEAFAKFVLAKVTGDARTAMEANLRRRIFACLLTEDTAVMDARSMGERRERLGSEVAHVADVVARSLTGGVKAAATAAHGAASLYRISWEISAVALGMVPPGVALFGAMGALSSRAHGKAAAAKERAASIAAERLAGTRTVRTFAQEDAELDRYDDALTEASRARRFATSVHALHLALFAAVPSTAVAAWLWYGGSLVERGAMTVGAHDGGASRAGSGGRVGAAERSPSGDIARDRRRGQGGGGDRRGAGHRGGRQAKARGETRGETQPGEKGTRGCSFRVDGWVRSGR